MIQLVGVGEPGAQGSPRQTSQRVCNWIWSTSIWPTSIWPTSVWPAWTRFGNFICAVYQLQILQCRRGPLHYWSLDTIVTKMLISWCQLLHSFRGKPEEKVKSARWQKAWEGDERPYLLTDRFRLLVKKIKLRVNIWNSCISGSIAGTTRRACSEFTDLQAHPPPRPRHHHHRPQDG